MTVNLYNVKESTIVQELCVFFYVYIRLAIALSENCFSRLQGQGFLSVLFTHVFLYLQGCLALKRH